MKEFLVLLAAVTRASSRETTSVILIVASAGVSLHSDCGDPAFVKAESSPKGLAESSAENGQFALERQIHPVRQTLNPLIGRVSQTRFEIAGSINEF